jgi:LacI family transcriptional regulator
MSKKVALLFNISKSYDRQIAQSIVGFAQQNGWSVYIEERPSERIPLLKSRDWDGIIADLDDFEFVHNIRDFRKMIPIVGCGGLKASYRRGLRLTTVDTDESKTAEMAIQHFVDRGYKHVAFCYPTLNTPDAWLDERLTAFVKSRPQVSSDHG